MPRHSVEKIAAAAWKAIPKLHEKKLKTRDPHVYYSDVVAEIGMGAPTGMGVPLWLIGRYCNEKGLPKMNLLVVNKGTKKPGGGTPESWLSPGEQEKARTADTRRWRGRRPTANDFKKLWEDR